MSSGEMSSAAEQLFGAKMTKFNMHRHRTDTPHTHSKIAENRASHFLEYFWNWRHATVQLFTKLLLKNSVAEANVMMEARGQREAGVFFDLRGTNRSKISY